MSSLFTVPTPWTIIISSAIVAAAITFGLAIYGLYIGRYTCDIYRLFHKQDQTIDDELRIAPPMAMADRAGQITQKSRPEWTEMTTNPLSLEIPQTGFIGRSARSSPNGSLTRTPQRLKGESNDPTAEVSH